MQCAWWSCSFVHNLRHESIATKMCRHAIPFKVYNNILIHLFIYFQFDILITF